MTGNNSYREKGRAVFLAAVMVLSLVAMSASFAGMAAANHGESHINGTVTVATSGDAIEGATVAAINQSSGEIEASATTDSNGEYLLNVSDNETYNVTVEVEGFELAENTVTTGTQSDDTINFQLNETDETVNETDETVENVAAAYDVDRALDFGDIGGQVVWEGQSFAVYNVSPNSTIQLRRVTDSGTTLVTERSSDGEGIVVFQSENQQEGNYLIRDGTTDSDQLEIVMQNLTTEFDADTVANSGSNTDVGLDVQSNRDTFDVNVSAEGLDASDLDRIFGADHQDDDQERITIEDVQSTDALTANFEDTDAGDYEFEFDVVDTTAADTAAITVEEANDSEAEAAIAESTIDQNFGDTAEFTVEIEGNTDTASVVIGNEEQFGYQANLTVTDEDDDGQVTVVFNTYTAGSGSAPVRSVEGSADTVTFVGEQADQVEGLIDEGDYDISVLAGDVTENANTDFGDVLEEPNDVSSLFIKERSTDEKMTLWTAPDGTELANLDDLSTAVEDGELTQTDSVARDDILVHEIGASGLSGLLDVSASDDTEDVTSEFFANLGENSSFNFEVEQTNPQQNRQPVVLNVSESADAGAFTVIADAENDNYYVVLDTSDAVWDRRGDDSDVEPPAGAEFNVEFTVQDSALLDVDASPDPERGVAAGDSDAFESANAAFTIEDREVRFDDDPVEVFPAEKQQIGGTTTIAPGSEITVRVSATGDTQPRFVETQEVTVQVNDDGDRVWNAEFDFSEQEPGDTFDVDASGWGDSLTVEGEVVKKDTPEEPDNKTEEPDNKTEEPDDKTEEPDDTTTTTEEPDTQETPEEMEQPGFGAVIALLALIGAALLAARRQS